VLFLLRLRTLPFHPYGSIRTRKPRPMASTSMDDWVPRTKPKSTALLIGSETMHDSLLKWGISQNDLSSRELPGTGILTPLCRYQYPQLLIRESMVAAGSVGIKQRLILSAAPGTTSGVELRRASFPSGILIPPSTLIPPPGACLCRRVHYVKISRIFEVGPKLAEFARLRLPFE